MYDVLLTDSPGWIERFGSGESPFGVATSFGVLGVSVVCEALLEGLGRFVVGLGGGSDRPSTSTM